MQDTSVEFEDVMEGVEDDLETSGGEQEDNESANELEATQQSAAFSHPWMYP